MRWRISGVVGIMLLTTACGSAPDKFAPIDAPFQRELGGHIVRVSGNGPVVRAKFFEKDEAQRAVMSGVACQWADAGNLTEKCPELEAVPIVHNGIKFFIRPKFGKYEWLRERPDQLALLQRPLLNMPVSGPTVANPSGGFDETYLFSRIETSLSEPSLQTTADGWPVASCQDKPNSVRQSCIIGFLVKGLSVEAHFSDTEHRKFYQSEIIAIATYLDALTRSLIIE